MTPFPPDIEQYVQQEIAAGQFSSRDELAIEAVRLYREIEAKHVQLKSDVQAAIDEADRGLCKPLDVEGIKSDLAAELDEHGQRR